jgi:hypothetical protein
MRRSQTGTMLVLVSVIDTVTEWKYLFQEGTVMFIALLLYRLGLLLYGVTLLRHKQSA